MNPPQENMVIPKDLPVLPTKQDATKGNSSAEEMVELSKYQALRALTTKFEKAANDEHTDAEKYRALMQQLSGGNQNIPAPDPIVEVERLRSEIVKRDVARELGVPLSQIHGSTESEMRDSAEAALSWAKSFAEQNGTPQAPKPVVADGNAVTGNTPPHVNGVEQIQTRDALKGMSSAAIMAAYRGGQLDLLLGKPQ
jgi:hypothetical protein